MPVGLLRRPVPPPAGAGRDAARGHADVATTMPVRTRARVLAGRRQLGAAAVTVFLLLCVAAGCWRAEGGRWYSVLTPSMGQAAPVGTLLLTRPVTLGNVSVGDLITFHPPGSRLVYSHRVVAETAGGLLTRGDINSSRDPWVLTQTDLIGRVAYRVWGAGWVLRALPMLLLCLALIWLCTAFTPITWRSPLRQLGASLSFAVLSATLRPWVGLQRLTVTSTPAGPRVQLVSTGILPIQVQPVHGGSTARLLNGQVGSVLIAHPDPHGHYNLEAALNLSTGWWIAITALCTAPLLTAILLGAPPLPPPAGPAPTGPGDGPDAPSLPLVPSS